MRRWSRRGARRATGTMVMKIAANSIATSWIGNQAKAFSTLMDGAVVLHDR